MPIYQLALFVHIVVAFGIIASVAIDALAVNGMRSAETAEQARPWLFTFRSLRILGPLSLGLTVVMGLYLMASSWGWRGWITGGLVGLVAIGAIGGLLTGTRMARIGPAVGPAQGRLTDEMRRLLGDPVLVLSSRLRIALVLGVLFLMSVKPSTAGSIVVLVIAIGLGAAVTPLWSGRRSTGVLQPSRR